MDGYVLFKQILETNFITKEGYHGGELEGGQCDKVFKKLDKLEALLPDEHKSIVDALEAIHQVNKAVSGKVLAANWKETLDTFAEKIMFLHGKYSLSITPKMHILLCHVEEYINLTGKLLGYVSDQTVEMCH